MDYFDLHDRRVHSVTWALLVKMKQMSHNEIKVLSHDDKTDKLLCAKTNAQLNLRI